MHNLDQLLDEQVIQFWEITYHGKIPNYQSYVTHSKLKVISMTIGSLRELNDNSPGCENLLTEVAADLGRCLDTEAIIPIFCNGHHITIKRLQLDCLNPIHKLVTRFYKLLVRDKVQVDKAEKVELFDEILTLFSNPQ